MPKKPRNKFIDLGLLAFIALMVEYFFLIALAASAAATPRGWGEQAYAIFGYLTLVLPFVSFGLCLYGWITMDQQKEKGAKAAFWVLIFSGLFIAFFLYQVVEKYIY